jgi:DNA-binding transcriptional LysR family regulator
MALKRITQECVPAVGSGRLQIYCGSSLDLLRSIQGGYLEVVFAMAEAEDMAAAVRSWPEDIVWLRSPDFSFKAGGVVPLISSPNLLLPDRIAMEALDRVNQRYDIVFSASDLSARNAAATAGLGYLVMPRRLIPNMLVIEDNEVLPQLRRLTAGIVVREDLDPADLAPLIASFEAILRQDWIGGNARIDAASTA